MAGPKLPSQNDDSGLMSDINVTPFVDVVLVLLVIFIVTAPALVKDTIGIKLPKASKTDGSVTETLGVAITAQGQILLNGKMTDPASFQLAVVEALKKNPNVQAIISADRDTKHSDLVHAIDLLKSAGLNRFALQVLKEETSPK